MPQGMRGAFRCRLIDYGRCVIPRIALPNALLLWSGATANAQTFCDTMLDMTAPNSPVQLGLPETGERTACTRSLMLSGGAQLHCGWGFAYRAPEATAAFEKLLATVRACLGAGAAVTDDLDVNHPDYYDLQTFQFGGREVGVSLKDKAASSQTYVFLRIALPK